jgi:hypothetical protein
MEPRSRRSRPQHGGTDLPDEGPRRRLKPEPSPVWYFLPLILLILIGGGYCYNLLIADNLEVCNSLCPPCMLTFTLLPRHVNPMDIPLLSYTHIHTCTLRKNRILGSHPNIELLNTSLKLPSGMT